MWEHLERTEVKEDANACILRVKYVLEGQYVEICPLKGAVIKFHWNACIGRLKQARKIPGALAGQSCVTASAAGSVPGGSAGKQANQG